MRDGSTHVVGWTLDTIEGVTPREKARMSNIDRWEAESTPGGEGEWRGVRTIGSRVVPK